MIVIAVGIQLGRSLANLLAGCGWTWPEGNSGALPSPFGPAFWGSLPEILRGHAEAGISTPTPDGLAGPGLVWASLALTETALLAATIAVGACGYQRWGPGRMHGMASSSEAERLLGVARLREVAGIVRPDLYGERGKGRR